MNIEGLNMTNAFANYNTKNIVSNHKETTSLFTASLNNSVKDKSILENNPSESKSPLKLHDPEAPADQLSELEDKYCSLCGSMLKGDGSCPICITPTSLSGNRQSQNPNVSQAGPMHSISGSSAAVATVPLKNLKPGPKAK